MLKQYVLESNPVFTSQLLQLGHDTVSDVWYAYSATNKTQQSQK